MFHRWYSPNLCQWGEKMAREHGSGRPRLERMMSPLLRMLAEGKIVLRNTDASGMQTKGDRVIFCAILFIYESIE